MEKRITLNLNKKPVHFNVTADLHERLINELTPTKKVGPMNNFLVRSVDPESKETLTPFLDYPSSVVQITEKVLEEYTPQISITLGE